MLSARGNLPLFLHGNKDGGKVVHIDAIKQPYFSLQYVNITRNRSNLFAYNDSSDHTSRVGTLWTQVIRELSFIAFAVLERIQTKRSWGVRLAC